MKKTIKLLFLLLVFSFIVTVNASTYYITGDGVRVRSTPRNEDNIIGKLNYGDVIDVISFDNSWYKIRFGNGYGYVTYRYVSKVEDSNLSNTIAVLKEKVSLKKSSSSSSSSITSIPKNSAVIVLKEKSDWSYVHYNEKNGYVKTKTLKKYTNKKEFAVGVYSVNYSIKNSNRKKNITKSAKKLNEVTIKNNQKFSFIKTIGKSGYSKAPEFNSKESINGGGISQVSTSLYLAIRDAQRNGYHINVTEQNRYGSKTPYAKLGEEAIIDLKGNKDLVFTNKSGKKLKLYSNITDDTVSIVL